jgi:hypothetical protein
VRSVDRLRSQLADLALACRVEADLVDSGAARARLVRALSPPPPADASSAKCLPRARPLAASGIAGSRSGRPELGPRSGPLARSRSLAGLLAGALSLRSPHAQQHREHADDHRVAKVATRALHHESRVGSPGARVPSRSAPRAAPSTARARVRRRSPRGRAGRPAPPPSGPRPMVTPSAKMRIAAGTTTLTVPGRSAIAHACRHPAHVAGDPQAGHPVPHLHSPPCAGELLLRASAPPRRRPPRGPAA